MRLEVTLTDLKTEQPCIVVDNFEKNFISWGEVEDVYKQMTPSLDEFFKDLGTDYLEDFSERLTAIKNVKNNIEKSL